MKNILLLLLPLFLTLSLNANDTKTKTSSDLFNKVLQLDLVYSDKLSEYMEKNCGKEKLLEQQKELEKANQYIKKYKETIKLLKEQNDKITIQYGVLKGKYKKVLLEYKKIITNKTNPQISGSSNLNTVFNTTNGKKENDLEDFINSFKVLSINIITIKNKSIKEVKMTVGEKTKILSINDYFSSSSHIRFTIKDIQKECVYLKYKNNKKNKEITICKD